MPAAAEEQKVPSKKSCTEQATSLGHTCVAARTVFGPPLGEMTGLGRVAW